MTDIAVMCVHATRRTRREARPGVRETRCDGCRASILISPETEPYLRAQGLTPLPLCAGCAVMLTDPEQLVGDTMQPPGLAEILADLCDDPEAHIARQNARTVREYAAEVLRRSVGGQG